MSVEAAGPELRVFEAGAVTLRSGAVLPDAQLAYVVHGALNDRADNAVLLPTFYGGTHEDVGYLIGTQRALDPSRFCIIVPNLFGNGVSSSPSTHGSGFPLVTIHDNVTVQHRLVREVLGIERCELVVGFSMGGQQAYEWACRFPSMVRRLAVLCGAARTAPHTWVFLEGVKAALCAGGSLDPGSAEAEVGKRALARVWAGWGLSQAWYREHRYAQDGHSSLEEYLTADWDADFAQADARDLLSMINTWQAHDVSGEGGREDAYRAALGAITASCLIMPSATDLYFPPEDSALEVGHLTHGRLATIDSVFGHAAGGGVDPADLAFITQEIRALLDSAP